MLPLQIDHGPQTDHPIDLQLSPKLNGSMDQGRLEAEFGLQ